MKSTISAAAVLSVASLLATGCWAADMPQRIVDRHVVAAKGADVPGLSADYADDAVIVTPPGMATPTGVFAGRAKVIEFLKWLTNAQNLPGVRTMRSSVEMIAPNVVLMRWAQFPGTPKAVTGTDVFVIRAGKIAFQSVAPAK